MKRAVLLLALCCASCVDDGPPGFLPGQRVPMAANGSDAAAAATFDGPAADVLLVVDVGAQLDQLLVVADSGPSSPDAKPTGAYGTNYAECPEDTNPDNERTPCAAVGGCRTADGYVCYLCDVTSPCAWGKNITQSEGPLCSLGRICVPKAMGCPITNGPRCTAPARLDGGGP